MSGVHARPREESKTAGFIKRHTKAFAIGTVLALLTMGGIAFAAWLVTANGAGSARSGAAPVAPTVQAISPASLNTGAMLPGETGPLNVKFSNPNSFPLYLKAIDVQNVNQEATSVTKVDGTASSCAVANWTMVDGAGLSIEVAPGVSTITVPNLVTLKSTAPIACADTVATFMVNGNSAGYTFDIAP